MESPRFSHGVFAGFAAFVALLQLVFAVELRGLRDMYRDFGDVAVPMLTRMTLHPAWLWGMPAVGVAAVAVLLTKRPRKLVSYVAVAAVLAAVAMATWYYARAPIFALAGNIKAD